MNPLPLISVKSHERDSLIQKELIPFMLWSSGWVNEGFSADQCAVILVGRWGLSGVKGTVVLLCLLPLDGTNPPEHWGVADAARWGTSTPLRRHPRINPHVQSRGYLLRVKSGDDDTRHTHTHTQFPLYSVWTPRSTSITVSSEPWCHWYLWLICRGSNAEL